MSIEDVIKLIEQRISITQKEYDNAYYNGTGLSINICKTKLNTLKCLLEDIQKLSPSEENKNYNPAELLEL